MYVKFAETFDAKDVKNEYSTKFYIFYGDEPIPHRVKTYLLKNGEIEYDQYYYPYLSTNEIDKLPFPPTTDYYEVVRKYNDSVEFCKLVKSPEFDAFRKREDRYITIPEIPITSGSNRGKPITINATSPDPDTAYSQVFSNQTCIQAIKASNFNQTQLNPTPIDFPSDNRVRTPLLSYRTALPELDRVTNTRPPPRFPYNIYDKMPVRWHLHKDVDYADDKLLIDVMNNVDNKFGNHLVSSYYPDNVTRMFFELTYTMMKKPGAKRTFLDRVYLDGYQNDQLNMMYIIILYFGLDGLLYFTDLALGKTNELYQQWCIRQYYAYSSKELDESMMTDETKLAELYNNILQTDIIEMCEYINTTFAEKYPEYYEKAYKYWITKQCANSFYEDEKVESFIARRLFGKWRMGRSNTLDGASILIIILCVLAFIALSAFTIYNLYIARTPAKFKYNSIDNSTTVY